MKDLIRRARTGTLAGLMTVSITTVLNLLSRAVGILPDSMDLRQMAAFIDPLEFPTLALIAGIAVHVIAGGLYGLIYGALVKRFSAKSGVSFMLALWLVMMLILFPMTGRGWFGIHEGWGLPVATLILHTVFGVLLGQFASKIANQSLFPGAQCNDQPDE